MEYYEVIDLEAIDSSLSNNGGDYDYWRVVVVENGKPIGVQWRCSAELDFAYCHTCDSFGHESYECYTYPEGVASKRVIEELAHGWERGRKINRHRWPIDEFPQYWLRVK